MRQIEWKCLRLTFAFVTLLIANSGSPTLAGGTVSGVPRIVDGDTVEIDTIKLRLQGIDAPETDQLCLDQNSRKWACGVSARDELIRYSAGRSWNCAITGADRYGRALGNCFFDGKDVSSWMVRQGWALSFVRYSHAYDSDEAFARQSRAGLWRGAFIAPWHWRYRNKQTEILGAVSVPVGAQAILLGSVSEAEAPDPTCTIKGNVNRKGERIYHLPGQRNYSKTSMTKGLGERWFCSKFEAEAAGWRKATY